MVHFGDPTDDRARRPRSRSATRLDRRTHKRSSLQAPARARAEATGASRCRPALPCPPSAPPSRQGKGAGGDGVYVSRTGSAATRVFSLGPWMAEAWAGRGWPRRCLQRAASPPELTGGGAARFPPTPRRRNTGSGMPRPRVADTATGMTPRRDVIPCPGWRQRGGGPIAVAGRCRARRPGHPACRWR
jgi:hypothetical protein